MAKKSKAKSKKKNSQETLEKSFAAALKAIENAPASEDAWDHAEELADELQRPEEVAGLYRQVLGKRLEKDVAGLVSKRALQFHEEWFGDDAEAMSTLLTQIIEIDPEADWAFDRLVMELTTAKEWDKLLAVYDKALAATQDSKKKKTLLNDATQVAKDFAAKPDRAADYLKQLVVIEPKNKRLVSSLERLLERLDRWQELVDLWRDRIPTLSADEVRSVRVRIADVYMEKIGDPAASLEVLRTLLGIKPGHPEGMQLLERILESDSAPADVRHDALSLLRTNYEATDKPEDVVRVLEHAIEFAEGEKRVALHKEAGNRLGKLGEDARAMEHYASLLRMQPTDAEGRKKLSMLAKRSGEHAMQARVLVEAAESCAEEGEKVPLLMEAARVQHTALENPEEAISLYSRVLSNPDADQATSLSAAHILNDLLGEVGRSKERLEVLDQLASLEQASSVKRFVLGEAARLAGELGDTDRAFSAWNARLESDERDLEALGALIDLFESTERWEELVEALRKRASLDVLVQQRRADLVRAARTLSDRVGDATRAIDAWLELLDEFGEQADAITALDELLASASRWSELASIIEKAAVAEHGRAGDLLARLGEVHRVHLDQPERAADFLAMALVDDPRNELARAGMKELLGVEPCTLNAARALTTAYEETDDWEATLELLEPRLAATPEVEARVGLLRRAAQLQEQRAEDSRAALGSIGRAFCLAPDDLGLEREFARLAAGTGDWKHAAETYRDAASACGEGTARAAQLRFEQGRTLEAKLEDPGAAMEAYQAALALDPPRTEINKDVARAASRADKWNIAASSVVSLTEALDYVDEALLSVLETAAEDASAWDQLAVSLGASVAERSESLRNELVSELQLKIAVWHRDHGEDLAVAESAAQNAVATGATHLGGLKLLAELQRRSPGPDLVQTLLKIDSMKKSDLDALYEAAEVGLETGDTELARTTLQKLYGRSTSLWRGSQDAEGTRTVEDATAWAQEKLVELFSQMGERRRAAQLLIDGSRLPFERGKTREMRLRAASILAEVGEGRRSIELYHEVLEETPEDLETVQLAASLSEREERIMELLALRQRELELTGDVDRRLELRIDISRLTGQFEERGGRVESLLANLEDMPGHEPSIDGISKILLDRGQYDRLADILTEQAKKLEELEEPERAAGLWARVARLAERNLADPARAIDSHSRVVELSCTNEALDALARLYIERDEPAEAAAWLERRLETATKKERVAIRLQLARASLRAEQVDQAISSLETAFEEAPRNAEVRRLLIDRYRKRESWKKLARVLTTAAEIVKDEATVIAYASEAFEIHDEHLGTREEAVGVLERAVSMDPDDRELKRMLVDALLASGRHDDAREIIEELIEGFGRRRSAERAGMHARLAEVAHAQGDTDLALDQLEQASKMDRGNVDILKQVADLAREAGNLERAELAYQTLLMTVRRRPEEEEAPPVIGPGEVLLELSRIATSQGQEDQASERLESAMEALAQNDAEADNLQANLRQHEQYDLLRRVLETRLANVQSARRRGRILSELADVLGNNLERTEEALDVRLQAVESDPLSPVHHEAARALALEQDEIDRYVKVLEKALKKARRDTDAYIRCELLLRLGEVMEKDKEDLDKASKFYAKAEKTGVREVDVWRAAASVAGARGDTEEQMRLLNQLASMGEDQSETRASAYYSMAEVHLAHEDTLAEGLETLSRALEDDPRYERAGRILGRAAEKHQDNDQFLDIFGQVARGSGDENMLLDYLELKSARPDATPEATREAVDLALGFEQWERAEALMLRAVEIGHAMPDDLGRIEWALLALAERRMHAGDLAGAVKWLSEAKDVGEPEKVFELSRRVAELAAGPEGDLTLMARLYESLLERYPTARGAWEPLADIYGQLGEVEKLELLVDETLDSLQDVSERNALRFVQAKSLLAIEEQVDSGVETLRAILMEDPEHASAQDLLSEHFENTGRQGDLIELLQNNLMNAQGRRDVPAITDASLRLGRILVNENPDEAVSVYRSSLEWAPKDPDLIKALLDLLGSNHDPVERAELMERRLGSLEGDEAAMLGMELALLYDSLGNEDGALRALELGYRASPTDIDLLEQLQTRYEQRGNHTGLAKLMEEAAHAQTDDAEKVPLLLRAAAIYRDSLGDHAASMKILDQASEIAPDDQAIAIELVSCMSAAGETDQAIEKISSILETVEGNERLDLLRMRSGMWTAAGNDAAALDDVEEAFSIDTALAPELEQALERRRQSAARDGEEEAERMATFRLIELEGALGNSAQARELLHGWIESHTQDVEALHMLRDLDRDDEYWEGVAATCAYLATLEEGDAQVEAVLEMSRAYSLMGSPQDARPGLEKAHEQHPDSEEIRAELRRIYEEAGIHDELARLLLEDATAAETADEQAELLRRAGELLTSAGEIQEAIPIFHDILELKPGDAMTTGALADAYIASGNVEEANRILDASIEELGGKRSPELGALLYRKSRVAESAEDLEQQLKWLHEAFKMDRHNGMVAAELANLAEAIEDWDLALQALRAIALIKTGCPISLCESLVRQGRISLRTGDEKRALFFARKAKKEDPEDPAVQELLGMLGEK